ncbi:hypothetical protein OsccyDRAFT_3789 [Leptolyngbyaceae cyanobacterium JSC-12]|nr:hypothetical protein OsccyDRAFT_3789 [Leptolyngbyaceae cyanobacterium JSC-12]
MSNRKLAKAIQRLFKQIWKLYRSLSKAFVTWLLRAALLPNRRRAAAGFVLPTTVFLILVVTLTAGALSYRAFNNSTRVTANVQSKEIYNAATPAIDRARTKIESLFADPRYPGGVPSEGFLTSMMLNDNREIKGTRATIRPGIDGTTQPDDPYTLLDEVRVDVNGDGQLDNAWIYHDNQSRSSIIYSVTFSTPPDTSTLAGWQRLLQMNEQEKANGADEPLAGPFVRTGPLESQSAVACRVSDGSPVEQGWYKDKNSTALLRKRFQVDAFVVKDDSVAAGRPPSITTLEFSQDRLLDRGNKWGAWFRNDLEIYPAPPFNWNGAMHTEGSLLLGGASDRFSAYLISSPNSCLFLPETNSEIEVRRKGTEFTGVIAAAENRSNSISGSQFRVHTYNGNQPYEEIFNSANHWFTGNKNPIDFSLDPTVVLTQDGYRARGGDPTNFDAAISEAQVQASVFTSGKRFRNDNEGTRPYIDDTYRADNRYGPKPVYTAGISAPSDKLGELIPSTDPNFNALTREAPAGSDTATVGLDGYWERRSIVEGLRILVGQRLELGNPAGWVTPKNRPDSRPPANYLLQTGPYLEGGDTGSQANNQSDDQVEDIRAEDYTNATTIANADIKNSDIEGDPLYPPYRFNDTTRAHEERQRRALRDNLAAVQATAIYHHSVNGGTYPVACLASTAHPGTPFTLQQSTNFLPNPNLPNSTAPWVDFFYGKGTNGWEFSPPAATEAEFADKIAAGQPLGNALRNLANFSGDPNGAFPFTPADITAATTASRALPDPTLTMWGNFSNLRRTLAQLDAGTSYSNLSPADKTYLHTAACTLGMLAYNINQVQQFNPSTTDENLMGDLAADIFALMDGNVDNGEVLPKAQLSTYDYNSGAPDYDPVESPKKYNPRDYDNATPAMFLSALKRRYEDIVFGVPVQSDPTASQRYQLALLIHEHFQIRRDRTFGFRPSPASNTWNYNPFVVQLGSSIAKAPDAKPNPDETGAQVTLWSSACNPNIFNVPGATASSGSDSTAVNTFITSQVNLNRLALSRLCGAVIPPGGVHDGVGDGYFPARDNNFATPPTLYTPEPELPYYQSASPNTQFTSTTLDASPANLRAQVAPEFPSLYYLFPEFNHDHDGDNSPIDHRQPGNADLYTGLNVAFQPWREPYITNPAVPAANTTAGAYQVVNSGTVAGSEVADYAAPVAIPATTGSSTPRLSAFNYIAFSPFSTGTTPVSDFVVDLEVTPKALGSWALPTTAGALPAVNQIRTASGNVAVPFLDKVLFNGREMQPSRVLDIDLDMLRRNSPAAGDAWLPESGIVYAFREDAVREDAILRPARTLQQTDARTPGAEADPPLQNGASVKAVDYVPDPDRRVHGFRLRNGERLKRIAGGIPDNRNIRGLSFFTDDLAYIMGDFNKHQTDGGTELQEFAETLDGIYTYDQFYGRTTRDTNFAKASTDEWRPSEVLADAIYVLSNNFCDGSLEDVFATAGNGGIGARDNVRVSACGGNVATSYLNQNRPAVALQTGWQWVRELPDDRNSPVKISRNGNPLMKPPVTGQATQYPGEYAGVYNNGATVETGGFYNSWGGTTASPGVPSSGQQSRAINNAQQTTVNTIMISGITPSRQNQAYGGLQNFPRFLEWWEGVPLKFSGSFIQLNFSNYGTAPFDLDAWEPGATPNGSEVLDYFGFAPQRVWGYDVGLQIAPAGPAANRFVQLSSTRNEFYNEPPANDFYMQNLCRSLRTNSASAPGGVNLNALTCPT